MLQTDIALPPPWPCAAGYQTGNESERSFPKCIKQKKTYHLSPSVILKTTAFCFSFLFFSFTAFHFLSAYLPIQGRLLK